MSNDRSFVPPPCFWPFANRKNVSRMRSIPFSCVSLPKKMKRVIGESIGKEAVLSIGICLMRYSASSVWCLVCESFRIHMTNSPLIMSSLSVIFWRSSCGVPIIFCSNILLSSRAINIVPVNSSATNSRNSFSALCTDS